MSKNRNLSEVVENEGVLTIPSGTTAQRPASPAVGTIRYNTTLGFLEQYNVDGWQSVSSISPSVELQTDDPQTIVISGSNFTTTVSVKFIGASGTQYTPDTVTRNSATQITVTFAGVNRLDGSQEPYSVTVTNSSGLTSTLNNALNINNIPTWVTPSGSVGTVYEDVEMSTITVSATDPESLGITYAITSGSLPSGVSLNTSTGGISGTPNVNDTYNLSGVIHNFTLSASDGANPAQTRAFSILRKWYDGSSAALAASSGQAINDLGLSSGVYYIKPTGYTGEAIQLYVDNSALGGGWMLVWKASRPLKYAGTISNSDIMTTNDVNLSELQQNRLGSYHARVNWLFLNKLTEMSNCRRAMRALYDTPYNTYDSGYAHCQKIGTTGRGTNTSGSIADTTWDPWQVMFNRSHWSSVAPEGGLPNGSGSMGTVNGHGTTFRFFAPGNKPGWGSSRGTLTGTVSGSSFYHWEDNSSSTHNATGTYAANVGNNGQFYKSRHSGAIIGDVNGGDEWIYSTQTSYSSESSSAPAYELVFYK